MQISNFVLYGAVEAFTLVCVITVILLAYIIKLKRKAQKVQAQTQALLGQIRQLKHNVEQAKVEFSTANTYKQQINDQLLLTREYHKSLDPGQDIALDLNTSVPLPRQAVAFRHALLIAEKEALHTSTDGVPNWKVLETKFSQIIRFYADFTKNDTNSDAEQDEPPVDQQQEIDELKHTLENILKEMGERSGEIAQLEEELEVAHKRVGNLEKFKQLFFEMEDQWKEAKQEAQIYYERLSAMRDEVRDTESFDDALQKYNNVYNAIEQTILANTGGEVATDEAPPPPAAKPASDKAPTSAGSVEILNSEKRALEELKKLRNLTADQHRLIHQLQKKLDAATSIEEKIETIEQLEQELRRQVGYVKESEMCIQLLEEELSRTMQKARSLEEELSSVRLELDHIPKMQATIRQFTEESKEMLKGLAELEQANESLAANPQSAGDNGDQLAQMHEQLVALQAQYADLEERYLEVRTNH